MVYINYSSVVVRKVKWVNRAYGGNKQHPEFHWVGDIDIRHITSDAELFEFWKEYVKLKGMFALLGKDHKGRFYKHIARINVSSSGIAYRDRRCTLYRRLHPEIESVEHQPI